MKLERFNQIKNAYYDGTYQNYMTVELLNEIEELRGCFQYIKDMENNFYTNVKNTEEFGEIRWLDERLLYLSGIISSLFGTVNDALTPKYRDK